MELGRPNQKNQPSRKGKKAWRKNIDIDEIQESFETIREVEREHGVRDMSTLKSDQLFQVDTTGDEELKVKRERKVKPLKADEILSRRSAVPALTQGHTKSEKNRKMEGLSANQVKKLLDRAGKSTVTKMRSNRVEPVGLTKVPTYDLWADDSTPVTDSNSFIADLKQATSYNKATTVPSTLGKNPLSLAPNRKVVKPIELPSEGKSYNPTIESWQALIKEEHDKEAKREEERLALEEKQNRIQLIISNYDDNGELSESEDEENEDADKPEEDGEDLEKLSVNKPVENKKKLRKQRNKEKRHAEHVKLEAELKALKKQIRDLENIPKLLAEAEKQVQAAIDANAAAAAAGNNNNNRKRKSPRLCKNHKLAELPLEVKLSDELTDSLRLLRPEGSLAKERFRSLQERGLIEPRVPTVKKRKYAHKITEKWAFKDIRL